MLGSMGTFERFSSQGSVSHPNFEGCSLLWYTGLDKPESPFLLLNLKQSGRSALSWASIIQTQLQGILSQPLPSPACCSLVVKGRLSLDTVEKA